MATPLQNRDITLLVIAAAGSMGLTPVQLMKSVFVVGRSGLPGLPLDFYRFYPYNYGPFHPDVYYDAERLEGEGKVVEVQDASQTWSRYVITLAGLEYAKSLRPRVDPKLAGYIDEVVAWVKSLTFNALLRAIYAKYPEFRKDSVFQE